MSLNAPQFIPLNMFSLPTFHLLNARTHANVDRRTSLLTGEPDWLTLQDPSSCWFCNIHSTHCGKRGVWWEPHIGTIETHAVSYEEGGNWGLRSWFLILFSSSSLCCNLLACYCYLIETHSKLHTYNNQQWGSYHVWQAYVFCNQPPLGICCSNKGIR